MYLPRWQCHLPQCHLLIKKVPVSSADTLTHILHPWPLANADLSNTVMAVNEGDNSHFGPWAVNPL